MTVRGRWIVFEGGEGAGKSGAILAVADALRQGGTELVATGEPGGTPEGRALRALLLPVAGPAWEPEAELLLMAAARVQHVQRVIGPALVAGVSVLCDRYLGSTLAYQGAGRGLPEALIRRIHRDTTGNALPDLTIVLDVDPAVGLARSRGRLSSAALDEGRFEALDPGVHERVRASVLAQAAADPRRSVVVDAGREQAVVVDHVVGLATAFLARRPSRPGGGA